MGAERDYQVVIRGLPEMQRALELIPKNIARGVVQDALSAGSQVICFAGKMNAYHILRQAEARGYRREKGQHLYETIGIRLKSYRAGTTQYIAAGPLYKEGGYHGHLVEFGHRIVKGGSMANKRGPGAITAAGARVLKSFGFKRGNYKIMSVGRKAGARMITARGSWKYKPNKKQADDLTITTAVAFFRKHVKASGKNIWEGRAIGEFAFGKRIRGGGRAVGQTKPHPFMSTAFNSKKRQAMDTITQLIAKGVEREAAKIGIKL